MKFGYAFGVSGAAIITTLSALYVKLRCPVLPYDFRPLSSSTRHRISRSQAASRWCSRRERPHQINPAAARATVCHAA
jgi:hypothetical protein